MFFNLRSNLYQLVPIALLLLVQYSTQVNGKDLFVNELERDLSEAKESVHYINNGYVMGAHGYIEGAVEDINNGYMESQALDEGGDFLAINDAYDGYMESQVLRKKKGTKKNRGSNKSSPVKPKTSTKKDLITGAPSSEKSRDIATKKAASIGTKKKKAASWIKKWKAASTEEEKKKAASVIKKWKAASTKKKKKKAASTGTKKKKAASTKKKKKKSTKTKSKRKKILE